MTRAPVENVEAADCYALRRAVLRGGDPNAAVAWQEDSAPGAFHLAVRADDAIVAVASFMPAVTPHRPGARSWQLRGMAVDASRQRHGYGVVLLDAGIGRLRAAAAEVLWANARDSALGFYGGYGMTVVGDGFVVAELDLPHHVVLLDL